MIMGELVRSRKWSQDVSVVRAASAGGAFHAAHSLGRGKWFMSGGVWGAHCSPVVSLPGIATGDCPTVLTARRPSSEGIRGFPGVPANTPALQALVCV
jgi:hypothetical protein